MKKLLYSLSLAALALAAPLAAQAQSVGINTVPNASAALDVSSTTQGMLVPRMSAAQRGLVASPATGLMVYQTDAPAGFYFYNGTAWTSLSGNTGPAGPQGPPGTTGPQGPVGNTGPAGATGAQGLTGSTGPIGSTGPAGTAGATGPAGPPGSTGPAGAAGATGQGVPTGGTTGQVLSKVNATDYNTQWTTASGGTTLPSQTGNAGKVLTTDGITTSWGSYNKETITMVRVNTTAGTTYTLPAFTNDVTTQIIIMYGDFTPSNVNHVVTLPDPATIPDGSRVVLKRYSNADNYGSATTYVAFQWTGWTPTTSLYNGNALTTSSAIVGTTAQNRSTIMLVKMSHVGGTNSSTSTATFHSWIPLLGWREN